MFSSKLDISFIANEHYYVSGTYPLYCFFQCTVFDCTKNNICAQSTCFCAFYFAVCAKRSTFAPLLQESTAKDNTF